MPPTPHILDDAVPPRVVSLVAVHRRRMAWQRAAWTATAWLAALGWLVLLPLAGSRLWPWPWPATASVGWLPVAVTAGTLALAVALWRGTQAARRVTAAQAARHLDGQLAAGRFALYTAWEGEAAADRGAVRGVLRQHVEAQLARTEAAAAPALPRWRHPALALVALAWTAVALWLALAVPMAAHPAGSAGHVPAAAGTVAALREQAAAHGDRALADAAADLHAALQAAALDGRGDGLAEALARAERVAARRREAMQRQARFLDALEQAQRTLAEGPVDDRQWQAMREALADTAAAAGNDAAHAALAELPAEAAAEVLAELAAREREAHNAQAAWDARWHAAIQQAAAGYRDPRAGTTASATADDKWQNPPEPREATHTPQSPSGGREPAGEPRTRDDDAEASAPTAEPLTLDLSAATAAPPPAREAVDAARVAPRYRALARRLAEWQQRTAAAAANADE